MSSEEFTAREGAETEVTAGTAVVRLVKNNPKRVALIIMNRSDVSVFISTKRTVTVATGFKLEQTAGSVTYTRRDFGFLPSKEFFVVTSANTKTIVVQEVIKG